MKKIIIVCTLITLATNSFAQAPNAFKYQAIIRNSDGSVKANASVAIQISIIHGHTDGPPAYLEIHNTTTSKLGLVNLVIGDGITSDDLSAVNWANGPYFIDITVNGTRMGTSPLLSVPYALYAASGNEGPQGPPGEQGIQGEQGSVGQSGPKGDLGDTGEQGLKGDKGDAGPQGEPGVAFDDTQTLLDKTWTSVKINSELAQKSTTDHIHSSATTSTDGFMDNSDKLKLESIESGATAGADWNTNIVNRPESIGDFNMDANNNRITNIADPIAAQDAASKAYVDDLLERIEILEGTKMVDIDGNVYNIVTIGSQVWMAENLRTTHYPDGTPIPKVSDNTTWALLADDNVSDAFCWYNNDSTSYSSSYGVLYTYAAAIADDWTKDVTPNQGVCPDGWHLPSDAELRSLTDFLGGTEVAGGKLKEVSTTYWNSPNAFATNESGFSAFGGGYRNPNNGAFVLMGRDGVYWSSTEGSTTEVALSLQLTYFYGVVYHNNRTKSLGFSVRCVKDQ